MWLRQRSLRAWSTAAVLEIKVILVLGHAKCGAPAIQGKEVPGQISTLYPHIQPAIDRARPDLTAVTKANAEIQARLLRESLPVIAPLVKDNKLKVVAAVYTLSTGKVNLS
jgi:carbonic anhydrase